MSGQRFALSLPLRGKTQEISATMSTAVLMTSRSSMLLPDTVTARPFDVA